MASSEKLSQQQIELVLRRAAEMDADNAPGESDEGLTAAEVVRLGREAGLRPNAVLQAMAEMRRGALVEATPSTALDRLWGPAVLIITRSVPGSAATVSRAVDGFLRQQLMTVRRHHGVRVEWERARGLYPGLARSVDFARRYAFGPVTRVETLVVPETAAATCVTFKIDLSDLRRGRLQELGARGAIAFALLGLGGAVMFPGFGIDDVLALVAGGAAAGGLTALERRRYDRALERIALEPERFLDMLAQKPRADEAASEDDG